MVIEVLKYSIELQNNYITFNMGGIMFRKYIIPVKQSVFSPLLDLKFLNLKEHLKYHDQHFE